MSRVWVFAGCVLCLIGIAIVLPTVFFRFDNPAFTETQLFNEQGWRMIGAVPLFVGGMLVAHGLEDDND